VRYLIALALEVVLAALASGQQFVIQPAGQPFTINPAVVIPAVAPVTDPAQTTCFVWLHSGGVGQAGTGTCIASEGGKSLVVTNAHVVEGTRAPCVVVNGGKEWRAQVLATARDYSRRDWDLALVVVDGELPVAPVAAEEPAPGERIRIYGFGGRMGSQGPALKTGAWLGRTFNADNVNATNQTISGDSGSGWFNDRGELVAVHWGNNGRAWGVPLQPVRTFARERGGPLFPRLAAFLADRKAKREKPPEKKAETAPPPKAKEIPPLFRIEPSAPKKPAREVYWPDTTGRMCRWDWPNEMNAKPVFLGYVETSRPDCPPGAYR
jgi:hypothetical protein